MAKVEEIMARSFVPGTSAKLEITGEFLPLVETADGKALFEHYARRHPRARQRTELDVHRRLRRFRLCRRRPARRPSAPSARSAARAHTPEEFMEVDTLVPRAQALALAILRLRM